jgi:hypothetical protein
MRNEKGERRTKVREYESTIPNAEHPRGTGMANAESRTHAALDAKCGMRNRGAGGTVVGMRLESRVGFASSLLVAVPGMVGGLIVDEG